MRDERAPAPDRERSARASRVGALRSLRTETERLRVNLTLLASSALVILGLAGLYVGGHFDLGWPPAPVEASPPAPVRPASASRPQGAKVSYQTADITHGGAFPVPPAWACGLSILAGLALGAREVRRVLAEA